MWWKVSNPLRKIQWYYNNSLLRKKLVIILIVTSVLPMIIIQLINYTFTTNSTKTYVDDISHSSLKQSHSEINSALNTYYSIITDISNNDVISENVSKLNVLDVQFELAQRALREELRQVAFSRDYILGIALAADNGVYAYYDSITLSSIESFCYDFRSIFETPMVQKTKDSPEEIFMETKHISAYGYENKNAIYLSKALVDYQNLKDNPIGTVILCIDESALSGAYQKTEQGGTNITFVVDQNGSVISANQEELLDGNIYGQTKISLENAAQSYIKQLGLAPHGSMAIMSYSAPNSNYTVINAQMENYLLEQIYSKGAWIIGIGLLAIILTLLVIAYTSQNITRAVKEIISAMHKANSGDLSIRIHNNGKDEFAQISHNFNEMIVQMKNLIKKEKHAINNKRKAEIKALEAQINPHFLYNTLDSINWLAIENEQFEISKMLKYLAITLRYSVHESNAVVTLEEELGFLRKYIYVQQSRFRYSFLCLIRAPEEVLECRVHKLLMQPLIENSIEHAFPGKTERDKIEINISILDKKKLQIVVSDNGIGMSDELIYELNHFDIEADSIKTNIGIRNVISRIKIYYGESGGFVIKRNSGNGISIVLTIPYEA